MNIIENNESLLNKCMELSERNAYGIALELIADELGFTKEKEILSHINSIHEIEGYMPSILIEYRSEVSKKLFKGISNRYGEDFCNELLINL